MNMANITDQEKPAPGPAYYKAVISSLEEAVQEYNDGKTEELPINTNCLCVDLWVQNEKTTYYDEETGEEIEIFTGDEVVKGHKFVVTTGGPHAEFRTTDHGETWSFFYCDWFESDKFEMNIHFDKDTVQEAFNLYFECGEFQEVGSIV